MISRSDHVALASVGAFFEEKFMLWIFIFIVVFVGVTTSDAGAVLVGGILVTIFWLGLMGALAFGGFVIWALATGM